MDPIILLFVLAPVNIALLVVDDMGVEGLVEDDIVLDLVSFSPPLDVKFETVSGNEAMALAALIGTLAAVAIPEENVSAILPTPKSMPLTE